MNFALLDARELDVLRTVQDAARLARAIRQGAPGTRLKPDRTPLTVADLAVQAVVASTLQRASSAEPLVAEEDASALEGEEGERLAEQALMFVRTLLPTLTRDDLVRLLISGTGRCTDRYWTLDPIDGTEGFLRGGHYVVSLALVEDHKPTLAMLACPTLDRAGLEGAGDGLVLVARRGGGTWIGPMGSLALERVRASDERTLSEARVVRSFVESHIDVDRTREALQAAGVRRPPVLMDSQAKHVAIAAGWADLLLRIPTGGYREYIWDQAAGTLAVEEAGGRVTDLDGRRLDFRHGRRLARNRGVLAANGHLHPLMLEVLRRVGP